MSFLETMYRSVASDFQSLFETPQETRNRQTLDRINRVIANETPEQKKVRENLERLPEYRKYAVVALVVTIATAIIGMCIGSLFLTLSGLLLTPAAVIGVRDMNILAARISQFNVIVAPNDTTSREAMIRGVWKYSLIEENMRNQFLSILFSETLIVPLFARPA